MLKSIPKPDFTPIYSSIHSSIHPSIHPPIYPPTHPPRTKRFFIVENYIIFVSLHFLGQLYFHSQLPQQLQLYYYFCKLLEITQFWHFFNKLTPIKDFNAKSSLNFENQAIFDRFSLIFTPIHPSILPGKIWYVYLFIFLSINLISYLFNIDPSCF